MKTIRITQSEADRLNLDRFPNAGPYPNITGMKRIYGGGEHGAKEVRCVSTGKYLYHVDVNTYNQLLRR